MILSSLVPPSFTVLPGVWLFRPIKLTQNERVDMALLWWGQSGTQQTGWLVCPSAPVVRLPLSHTVCLPLLCILRILTHSQEPMNIVLGTVGLNPMVCDEFSSGAGFQCSLGCWQVLVGPVQGFDKTILAPACSAWKEKKATQKHSPASGCAVCI